EERLTEVGARLAVELSRGRGDLDLHRDLRGMVRREGGELGREVGATRREPREHRAFLVEEVAGDRALEVGDGGVDALDVLRVGPARGEAARGLEEARHHV